MCASLPRVWPDVLLLFPLPYTLYVGHSSSMGSQLGPKINSKVLSVFREDFLVLMFFRYNVTGLSLVPSFVHQIVNHPDVEKVDLSSVTNVNCGASYLSSDLFAKMKKLLPENTRFLQGKRLCVS